MKQQKHMTACRGIHSHQVNSDTNPGGKKYIEKNKELKTNQEVNCETKRRNTWGKLNSKSWGEKYDYINLLHITSAKKNYCRTITDTFPYFLAYFKYNNAYWVLCL